MMLGSLSAVERAAIAEFPALRRLIDLRDAGWTFFARAEDGDVVEIRGLRTWPEGYADVIMVRDVDDAAALRGDHHGSTVWQREGSVAELVDCLITLPPPSAPTAPRLAKATMPRL
jgi:hypothetical protein